MPRITRRELTVAGSGLVIAAQVPDAWAARLLRKRAAIGPGAFPDGVASGDPTPTSLVFWSRLDTDRQRSGARLVVATDEGLTQTVATVVVPTHAAIGNTLKVRVGGLKPGTQYWYAWRSADATSDTGRTKTLNPPDSAAPLRLAFSSCQHWAQGFFTPHRDAAGGEPLDLAVFLGDYTYEYGRLRGVRADRRPSLDLQSYRDKLRLYRSDAALRELHRLNPTVAIWDDHEVANNYTDGQRTPSALQRATAYKAHFEWMPQLATAGQRYGIYRSIRLGAAAELFMLDGRQYRTGYGDGQPRSMLGVAQLDWFRAALSASPAAFKLVANPVMFAPLRIPGRQANQDSWDGTPAERQAILNHLRGVPNTVFVSGDTHTFFTAKVLANGGTSGPPVATEYVAGSVTSRGMPGFEGATAQSIFEGSPWITFVDGDDHGYALCEVNTGALRTTYRASDLSHAGGGSRTLAIYDQPLGANDYTTTYQDPSKPTPPEDEGTPGDGPLPGPIPARPKGSGSSRALPSSPSAASQRAARSGTRALARRRRRLERSERAATERSERAAPRTGAQGRKARRS